MSAVNRVSLNTLMRHEKVELQATKGLHSGRVETGSVIEVRQYSKGSVHFVQQLLVIIAALRWETLRNGQLGVKRHGILLAGSQDRGPSGGNLQSKMLLTNECWMPIDKRRKRERVKEKRQRKVYRLSALLDLCLC